jgi:hypothetical protein
VIRSIFLTIFLAFFCLLATPQNAVAQSSEVEVDSYAEFTQKTARFILMRM